MSLVCGNITVVTVDDSCCYGHVAKCYRRGILRMHSLAYNSECHTLFCVTCRAQLSFIMFPCFVQTGILVSRHHPDRHNAV